MTDKHKTPQELLEEFASLPDVRQRLRDARKIVDDIDNREEIERLREIAADIQERAAELGLPRLRNLDVSSFTTGAAPAPTGTPTVVPNLKDGATLSKRERQIEAIVAEANAQGFDVLNIPPGGKALLKKMCMAAHPELFGAGPDPFKEAWQEALNQRKVRTAHHSKYTKR